MKTKILFLFFMVVVLAGCNQNSASSGVDPGNTDETSIESAIQFIQDKCEIITKATHHKTVPFEIQCDERSSTQLERKYDKKGALSYLKYVECGGHGCRTKHHYYWEGELIYIFHENDFTPGHSHVIEEHHTYFRKGQMIRCLEKEARYYPGQPPMEELLKKAAMKEVDCTPEKLTAKLSEIESLSLDKAQAYFCSSSQPDILGSFYSAVCSDHFEIEPFECECFFSLNGESKEPAVFVSNMEERACVKVNGQLNALYPDWEERDYQKELKELSNSNAWMSVDGDQVNYFGKPLSFYKYENAVEFLTDLVLASGRNMDKIPMQNSGINEVTKKLEAQAQQAIAKAKAYQAKGVDDPLMIVKFDNRSYDVFLRFRQTTQFEGEANHYEGKITLLKNRTTEILATKFLKGTCGC